jgi:hypothetical protein
MSCHFSFEQGLNHGMATATLIRRFEKEIEKWISIESEREGKNLKSKTSDASHAMRLTEICLYELTVQ